MPNATKKTGHQLDLIARRRRRLKRVRLLADSVIRVRADILNFGRSADSAASIRWCEEAFAIACEWHGK